MNPPGEMNKQRLDLLALMGSFDGAGPTAAGDPRTNPWLEGEWESARGGPWLLALAMWAGVDLPRFARAVAAFLRAGVSTIPDGDLLAPGVTALEQWGHTQGPPAILEEVAHRADELATGFLQRARTAARVEDRSNWGRLTDWARALESTADYALVQSTNQADRRMDWELIAALAAAVASEDPARKEDSSYVACGQAVRQVLQDAPQVDPSAPDSEDHTPEGTCYLEVGFEREQDWLDAERCWHALRPARAMADDPVDGVSIWTVVRSAMPLSERKSRDVLTSLDQCDMQTGPARRLTRGAGQLSFEPQGFPYGGAQPVQWFAEAFRLRILAVDDGTGRKPREG